MVEEKEFGYEVGVLREALLPSVELTCCFASFLVCHWMWRWEVMRPHYEYVHGKDLERVKVGIPFSSSIFT